MEPASNVIRLDDYRRRPPDPIAAAEEEPGPSLPWKESRRGNPGRERSLPRCGLPPGRGLGLSD